MSLWRTYATLVGSNDKVTEPPGRALVIAVTAGIAHVAIVDVEANGARVADEPTASFIGAHSSPLWTRRTPTRNYRRHSIA